MNLGFLEKAGDQRTMKHSLEELGDRKGCLKTRISELELAVSEGCGGLFREKL